MKTKPTFNLLKTQMWLTNMLDHIPNTFSPILLLISIIGNKYTYLKKKLTIEGVWYFFGPNKPHLYLKKSIRA